MARTPIEAYRDPYRRCERQCNHDLARGVTIAELLGADGPYPDVSPLLSAGVPRGPVRHSTDLIAVGH